MIALSIAGLIVTNTATAAESRHSTNLYGALGLNTVPSARMDTPGTIRTQLSHLDPYAHAFLGMQMSNSFYTGIRQTAEYSSFSEDAKHLYPGIDAKLRLVEETAQLPAIAIGVQSGTGHKRQGGEYIALSKRYKNFDLTGGIGWGRFATAAHIDNPLKVLGNHFDKERDIDGDNPNKPQNWFTGDQIGFFAGLEYFTPLKGLSLKADYGGDRYEAEKSDFNFRPAAPWSIGANYKPWDFMDISLATQGTEKVMARLSLQGNVKNWRHQSTQSRDTTRLAPFRTSLAVPKTIQTDAQKDSLKLHNLEINEHIANAELQYSHTHAAPLQIGKTAIHIANNAGPSIEKISITPTSYGLRGPSINLIRTSLESAIAHNNGSPEEIWHTTEIKHAFKGLQSPKPKKGNILDPSNINFLLDTQIDLSEEETSLLRRTSFITSLNDIPFAKYFTTGLGLRLNLNDNISKLKHRRTRSIFPIRSDEYDFADRFFALDTAYIALPHTLLPNTHTNITTGYVDEMFAGTGAEILYRPFDKRFAIGADSWLVYKRDPTTTMNLDLKKGSLFSAHINGWYDIPEADMTLGVKAGRYLAKDFGATLNLTKNFKNGATLEGYASISDKSDPDPYGGTTHADHGIRLSLPLGGFKYTPNSAIKLTAAPFGRDIAQSVENPLPLYNASEPFSLAHINRHWDELDD
jgi:hypothetical protein